MMSNAKFFCFIVVVPIVVIPSCSHPANKDSVASFNVGAGPIYCLAYSPNGKLIALGCEHNIVELFDPYRGQIIISISCHSKGVNTVSFAPEGDLLATGSWDASVMLWDLKSIIGEKDQRLKARKSLKPPKSPHLIMTVPGQVRRLAFGINKTLAIEAGYSVAIWDLEGEPRELKTFQNDKINGHCFAFAPSYKTLAIGYDDHTVLLWDTLTGKLQTRLQGHTNCVSAVAFSKDGATLASSAGQGEKPGEVILWDLTGSKPNLRFFLAGHWVTSLAFSPDGKLLASGGGDKMLKLWDVNTGQLLDTLRGHYDQVSSVEFSPSGDSLASGSFDGSIKLWSVPSILRERHSGG